MVCVRTPAPATARVTATTGAIATPGGAATTALTVSAPHANPRHTLAPPRGSTEPWPLQERQCTVVRANASALYGTSPWPRRFSNRPLSSRRGSCAYAHRAAANEISPRHTFSTSTPNLYTTRSGTCPSGFAFIATPKGDLNMDGDRYDNSFKLLIKSATGTP